MPTSDRFIRIAASAAVGLLATIAFAVSFRHIYDLAIRVGEDPMTAQLYPLTVDGLLITSALVGLYCSRYRLPQPPLARFGLLLGIGATVVCNIAHGLDKGLGAAIFAGWPAVALLLAAEMLLWLVGAAQLLSTKQLVVIDEPKGERKDNLSATLSMLASEPGIAAAEIGRRLGLRYDEALRLTKQARTLLTATR